MFFQLLFIHLFKPFLKYTQSTSPLPSNVSPRKLCTQAAAMISKLLRLYKRSHGLRQICNIAVYIVHSACTIHLLNLPDKNAKRDIIHGVKQLEEIAESWLCARRSLGILSLLARKWNVILPPEAEVVLQRIEAKFGPYKRDAQSPGADTQNASQMSMNYLYAPSQIIPATTKQFASYTQTSPLSTTHPLLLNGSINALGLGTLAYQSPPQNASGMVAHQHPSAVTTPGSSHRIRSDETGAQSATASSSPNGMFGGIDQLLRQSQDWAYKDQAQFGTGFGNWTGAAGDDTSSSWLGLQQSLGSMGQQSPTTARPLSNESALPFDADLAIETRMNGRGTMPWSASILNNKQFDAAMSYDEDAWYQ